MDIEFKIHYDHWLRHEINYCQNPLFVNIPENERIKVWKQIEGTYLKKYTSFVRVEFDWGSSGIWNPPYPGSISSGPMWPIESFYKLPKKLIKRLEEWVNDQDENSLFNDKFDNNRSDNEGKEITLEMRKFIPENIYLEFLCTFKEIKIIDGKPIELDIPTFIRKYQTAGNTG